MKEIEITRMVRSDKALSAERAYKCLCDFLKDGVYRITAYCIICKTGTEKEALVAGESIALSSCGPEFVLFVLEELRCKNLRENVFTAASFGFDWDVFDL